MGTDAMGRVTVAAKIENWGDLYMLGKGLIQPDQVHRIEVGDARLIREPQAFDAQVAYRPIEPDAIPISTGPNDAGVVTVNVYCGARLTIQGRECQVDVVELPEGSPVFIGQVPLELLDFVVDPATSASSATRRTAESR